MKSKLKINLFKDASQPGIWQFSSYLSPLENGFKLSLSEGSTQEKIVEEDLILKREDENPTGSWKDRGMAFLISKSLAAGEKDLVLSSSGNAAISSAAYCQLAKINLFVFVSPMINKGKLGELGKLGIKTFISNRPVSDAVKYAREKGITNLRPSENEFGPEGYQTIAFELALNQGLVEDIFLPVSSGVGLVGIGEGFKKIGLSPRIHVCQSSAVCPMASVFDNDYIEEKESLAEALVAKYTPLKNKVVEWVKNSGGSGWIIGNQEIIEAQKFLKEKGIETSAEGALALAAIFKARKKGRQMGKTVCVLTGKKY